MITRRGGAEAAVVAANPKTVHVIKSDIDRMIQEVGKIDEVVESDLLLMYPLPGQPVKWEEFVKVVTDAGIQVKEVAEYTQG